MTSVDFYNIQGPKKSKWENFQELIYQLVIREYSNAKHIDGSSGDFGADIIIGNIEENPIIFQTKYYLYGLRVMNKKSIESSLKIAKMRFNPKRWILCIPQNLTLRDHEWVDTLKTNYSDIVIEVWDESIIRSKLLQYNDVLEMFFPAFSYRNDTLQLILDEIRFIKDQLGLNNSISDNSKIEHDEKTCFVLMPFKSPFNEYYKEIIVPAAKEAELEPLRADEIFGTQPVIRDIGLSILKCRILIAELTGKNPNVLYELGLAHALKKPVILITQKMDDVPFDLKHLRCIVYDTSRPHWAEELQSVLTNTILTELTREDQGYDVFK